MRLHAIALGFAVLASLVVAGCAKPTTPEVSGTKIEMKGFKFVPDNTSVPVGTKVTWVNMDDAAHTVTSDGNAGPLDSASIVKGQSHTFTFTQAGTFKYYCKPHAATMKGTITVTA